jgi:hypothetical protein
MRSEANMTGLRPNLRYDGTVIIVPTPYRMFGYEMRPEAFVGVMAKASANMPMYTEGPRSAEFPRKEYNEQIIRIIIFFHFGHWRLR